MMLQENSYHAPSVLLEFITNQGIILPAFIIVPIITLTITYKPFKPKKYAYFTYFGLLLQHLF